MQAGIAAAAVPLMTGGLAAYFLTDSQAFAPIVIGGSLLAVVGMALFLVILVADMRRGHRAGAALVERPA